MRRNWLLAEGQRGAHVVRRLFFAALPFFIWAAIASFLGFIVGFAAVILPPTGTFGIVAVVGLVLLWVMPDLEWGADAGAAARIRHSRFLYAVRSELLRFRFSRPTLDHVLPAVSLRTDLPLAIAIGGSSSFRGEIRVKLANEKLISTCVIGFLVWSALSSW